MADYVVLFYGKEFLEAPLLADAGLNDLEAWQFMESYREHQPDLAEGVLANMTCTWTIFQRKTLSSPWPVGE